MKVAIYARVSTIDKGQDINMQLHELRAYIAARSWTLQHEYTDNGISGAKADRPALKELMRDATQRKFDAVVVWKLDRFGRTIEQLINNISELQDLNVTFISLKDSLDFSTAAGKLQFHIISAFAEYERNMMKERIMSGLENAKRKGKKLGRRGLAPIELQKIIAVFETEPKLSIRALAKKTGFTKSIVHKTIADFRAGRLDRDGFKYTQSLV